ncbi:N-acetylmuramoyl-L-alanine amidase [Kitasatospora sp. RB6PN24]|uniref:N-acetylmuramoyl-L-alanine amidase n=1 Tax=Kitasatospora humi TaxID=2893891 RepID=UPI001E473A1F|nr:N-acetylmuramoyl-L-alanine amidase [Kitasatospora humi]MCC9312438.1 N-acetylmuramoyl-L-alanine amidase [Kitasatospora humi]
MTVGAVPAFAAAAAAPAQDTLQRQFSSAAAEFHVPASVLLAVSYQQTRWDSHQGTPSTTGNYNVMGLTQVDAAAVTAALAKGPGPETDGRGDSAAAKPAKKAPAGPVVQDGPALHTLDEAARLIHRPADDLKRDTAQSVRGGAALLAKYQKETGKAASADPGSWYQAVARFSQAGDPAGAGTFADRVFATIRTGASRHTADGQSVVLTATPGVKADRPAAPVHAAARAAAAPAADDTTPECPVELDCDFQPAAYALTDPNDLTSFGNYSKANRPDDGDKIQYIVIHDTEGGFDASIGLFQNPANQDSSHYIVRSSDGHVTQLVHTKDIAWHAGNKSLNMHGIGIEHEGYALPTDRPTWYSEQLYQSSADLVRYLAARYDIPLDRQHIIGHDDVPGPIQSYVAGMHWDPGTFWDWSHYMDLLGAPVCANLGGPLVVGGVVTVSPAFDATNQPPVTGTADRPENFVYLRTQPDPNAPLINSGTTQASDWHDKAVYGTSYVVADLHGDWTAIWYDGQKAWFYNPSGQTGGADNRPGRTVLTPKPGVASIPVYGRNYPEAAAYTSYPGIAPQPVVPLTATIPAGQSYVSGSDAPVPSDFFYSHTIDDSAPNDWTLVVGADTYYPIRYNHRLAYLKASDVQVGTAATPVDNPMHSSANS